MKITRSILLLITLLGNLAQRWVQAPSPRAVRNLETFARLYGYVRYFHPGDEAAATDWNSLAELGSERAVAARTDAELQTTLLALFQPLAPTLRLVPASTAYSFDKATITPPNLTDYQSINWQHLGYGQDKAAGPYRSQRTHSPTPAPTSPVASNRFGSLTKSVDAKPYRGSKFRAELVICAWIGG